MILTDTLPGTHWELLVATSNPGKLSEIRDALHGLQIKVRQLDEFPSVSPVEEVGLTYQDNAILKALSYSKQTGLFALADDSGLEVDALGGGPGPLSARFGGAAISDSERTQKLLLTLTQRSDSERSSRFVCCVALAGWLSDEGQLTQGDPTVLAVTEGRCEGFIADRPRGSNGFGYDPVFIPTGYQSTFAELPSEVKNKISHRAKALASMREFLKRCPGPNLTAYENAP
jgi:XTP/dITP diphosphohydrolase